MHTIFVDTPSTLSNFGDWIHLAVSKMLKTPVLKDSKTHSKVKKIEAAKGGRKRPGILGGQGFSCKKNQKT